WWPTGLMSCRRGAWSSRGPGATCSPIPLSKPPFSAYRSTMGKGGPIMRAQETATESIDRIPVIDLAPFRAGSAAGKQQVAKEIRDAAESLGFLYFKNHGVPQSVIDGAFA